MRSLLLLVLGLILGAMGATMVVNMLSLRDAYPRSVMTVMGHHAAALHLTLRARQCDAARSAPYLARMQAMTDEILPAFPDMDAPFREGVDKLRQSLGAAETAAPRDCPALQQALKPIDDACDACHRQYR